MANAKPGAPAVSCRIIPAAAGHGAALFPTLPPTIPPGSNAFRELIEEGTQVGKMDCLKGGSV